ncbi:MAG TPA: hypothetical protein VGG06_26680 [Thermoanaerobaculia bacterium]|jgi:hypothetical protein
MEPPFTLPFDSFWQWLVSHPNCILRAGTPEAVLYDDDDLHWHFASYDGGTFGVQVLRGKRYAGEIYLDPEQVAYVQGVPGEADGEHEFELISETETDRTVVYFFVLAHGYEDDTEPSGRVH